MTSRSRMFSFRWLATVALVGFAASSALASTPDVAIESHADVRTACAEASSDGPRRLYSVRIPARDVRFLTFDAEQGFLAIDTTRNLRALRGSLELIPSRLEPIGFTTTSERAAAVIEAVHEGRLSLRLGFFLGFDNRTRTLCVVRPSVGVTTARIDVAYVELVDTSGQVVLRDETERLRAFTDDSERSAIPGEGPRAALGDPRVLRGPAWSAAQRRAFAEAQSGLRAALGRCYADALGRGAPREAQTLVRLTVDSATGSVQQAETELSTLADPAANNCVGEAFRASLRFTGAAPGTVVVEVPVRFASE